MNTNNNNQNIQNLLGTAVQTGDMNNAAASVAIKIAKGNPKIANLGASVDNIADSEAISFHLLLDDSSSISFASNTQPVRDGVKIFLDSIMGAKKRSNILVAMDCLNGGRNIDLPYSFLVDSNDQLAIPYLDHTNYNPSGGTPLYKRSAEAATQLLAKIQQIRQAGLQERSFLIIVTDGEDCDSSNVTADDVKKLVDEILKSETNGVFAIGLDNGRCDFRQILGEMGVPATNIYTPDAMDPKEIRRAFQTMSQSASAAATGTATGGAFGS